MSDGKLEFVQDVRPYWSWVRKGLEDVLLKTKDRWIPEDVYLSLMTGKSHLFKCSEGFVITTMTQDQYSKESCLHIWIAWGPNTNVLQEAMGNLEKMALDAGAKRISFISPRRWDNVFDGFRVASSLFEKELA